MLFIIGYAVVQYCKSEHSRVLNQLRKELSEVKTPSDEEIRIEAARSAKLEYPVNPPLKTPEQISREASDSAKALAGEKYNPRNIAEKISGVMKLYEEARPGQEIEFLSKNRSGPVKGTYKGKEGLFILVDNEKYSMRDILDDFKYLFDSAAATFKTQEKIKEIRNSYKAESDKFYEENRKRIEQELYTSSGYARDADGAWRAKSDIFNEAYLSLKQLKEKNRLDETRRISERHKLFGLFQVEPETEPASSRK